MAIFYFVLYLIPKRELSRLVGWLFSLHLPLLIRGGVLRAFASFYRIQIEEAERPLLEYQSVDEFFVRKLGTDRRPVSSDLVLHPADSCLTAAGALSANHSFQVKGNDYLLSEFIPGGRAVSYERGAYGVYYLCPTDYHRVHAPMEGWVRRVTALPGCLWPVNEWSVRHIPKLFSVNERVIIEMETAYGELAVVLVGATNVGQISLPFWPELRTNQPGGALRVYEPPSEVFLQKGEELGAFHLGSTVVVIFSETLCKNLPFIGFQLTSALGNNVRVRQGISVGK